MAKKDGWIKLHRSIQECSIWETDMPFDYRSAWVDLLLSANHRDKELIFDSKVIVVKKGQLVTSVRKLSSRWHWSVKKTYGFLNLLIGLQMLEKKSDNRRTLLTIVNYGIYQDLGNTEEHTQEHSKDNTQEHTEETQTTHKQEYKEVKNIYKDIVEKKNLDKTSETIKAIIEYLNAKCGTNYKPSAANTKKHINARLNDGYSLDDFKSVIDKKYSEWHGTKMEQYLRPDTLFGTKFESYFNQKIVKQETKPNSFSNFKQNDYDFDEFEKQFLDN